MTIKELLHELTLELKKEDKLTDIDFEDYNGNTLFFLSDLDLADLENGILRLQNTIK